MFFSSRLQSCARRSPRNPIFKEEFDSDPTPSVDDRPVPDMPTPPTPRELRRLASDHNVV